MCRNRKPERGARIAMLALAILSTDCMRPGPLDKDEQSRLPGSLVYVSEARGAPIPTLFRFDGRERVLTGTVAALPYASSPDGRLLATVTQPGDGSDDLLLIPLDGTRPRRVAPSPAIEWYPRFSPDGTRLLFESNRSSFRDLYTLNLAHDTVTRLTQHPSGSFDGAWSPDGREIAFVSSRAGSLDLYVMQADGRDVRRLTQHPGDAMKPAWSSDGRWIAFMSGRDGRDDLFVIRRDGSGLSNLSASLTRSTSSEGRSIARDVEGFEWHPKAPRLVATVRTPREGGRLFVLELDGKSAALTKGPGSDSNPTWSPDGAWLAFTRSEETREQAPHDHHAGRASSVWIARADGARQTRVAGPPAWLPRWLSKR